VIDAAILLVVGLGVFAEVRRGLFLALSDIVRIVAALLLGMPGYSVAFRSTQSYTAGFVAFGVVAIVVVMLVPFVLYRLRLDPEWGRTVAGRIGAGAIGFGIGFFICASFVPVLGRSPRLRDAVAASPLSQPFLEMMPLAYYAADALNLDLPILNARAVRFEDEGAAARAVLVERINYSRLAGSTCIECGAEVGFAGYRRRFGTAVSPLLVCSACGRRSDGCQTFEGFHRMYHRCPADVAAELGPIDCGVWPNDRPVYPRGVCPIDGKTTPPGLR
jgi:hypothetical protein